MVGVDGGLTKSQTHKNANRTKRSRTYRKRKQSQDFCFVSSKSFNKFLEKEIGIKKGDIESNVSKIEERLRPQAAREVKALFLLNEIAKTENVQVEPAEVDKAIEIIANQVKKDKKKLLEEYEEKDLLQNIIEQIREEKVMEFLLKEAEITEK